ncbi:MAG: cell wall hydrolase [Proteobacteria bacterium]|nr:cell wall hydrolase [Pseudomonadota bacterium]
MDDPIIRTAGTTKQYYHQDGLGSVVAVSDQTGATTGTQRFDAWGNKQSSGSTGTVPQYGYTGREPDETGLVYYRARYYDPTIGRFTQRDPIGMNGGINPYAYVNANPVNFTDPMGLKLREIGQMNYDTQITNYFNTSNDTTQGQGLSAGSQGLSQVAASNETTDEAQKVVAQGGWPWAAISLASTSDSPASINRLNAIFWLAKIIYAESRSDWRVPGALEATAWTVRNRVETEGFPWTYYEVITAPDQFSSVTSTKNTGWGDFVNTNLSKEKAAVRDRCFEVAKGVYDGSTADPTKAVTGGALFFHAVDPSYQPLPGEIRFGGQVYYRNYKKW